MSSELVHILDRMCQQFDPDYCRMPELSSPWVVLLVRVLVVVGRKDSRLEWSGYLIPCEMCFGNPDIAGELAIRVPAMLKRCEQLELEIGANPARRLDLGYTRDIWEPLAFLTSHMVDGAFDNVWYRTYRRPFIRSVRFITKVVRRVLDVPTRKALELALSHRRDIL